MLSMLQGKEGGGEGGGIFGVGVLGGGIERRKLVCGGKDSAVFVVYGLERVGICWLIV